MYFSCDVKAKFSAAITPVFSVNADWVLKHTNYSQCLNIQQTTIFVELNFFEFITVFLLNTNLS